MIPSPVTNRVLGDCVSPSLIHITTHLTFDIFTEKNNYIFAQNYNSEGVATLTNHNGSSFYY